MKRTILAWPRRRAELGWCHRWFGAIGDPDQRAEHPPKGPSSRWPDRPKPLTSKA